MAQTVTIITKDTTTKIAIDGNEIQDVLSYELAENADFAKLTIEIAITGGVEVQR